MSDLIPNSHRAGPDSGGHFGAFGGRYVAETLMPLLSTKVQAVPKLILLIAIRPS